MATLTIGWKLPTVTESGAALPVSNIKFTEVQVAKGSGPFAVAGRPVAPIIELVLFDQAPGNYVFRFFTVDINDDPSIVTEANYTIPVAPPASDPPAAILVGDVSFTLS